MHANPRKRRLRIKVQSSEALATRRCPSSSDEDAVVPFSSPSTEGKPKQENNYMLATTPNQSAEAMLVEDPNTHTDSMSIKKDVHVDFEQWHHHRAALDIVKLGHSPALNKRYGGRKNLRSEHCDITQTLREAEYALWEEDPAVRVLRKALLVCCWSAVATFVLIPAGFSMAYAMSFPDETSIKWYRQVHGWPRLLTPPINTA